MESRRKKERKPSYLLPHPTPDRERTQRPRNQNPKLGGESERASERVFWESEERVRAVLPSRCPECDCLSRTVSTGLTRALTRPRCPHARDRPSITTHAHTYAHAHASMHALTHIDIPSHARTQRKGIAVNPSLSYPWKFTHTHT